MSQRGHQGTDTFISSKTSSSSCRSFPSSSYHLPATQRRPAPYRTENKRSLSPCQEVPNCQSIWANRCTTPVGLSLCSRINRMICQPQDFGASGWARIYGGVAPCRHCCGRAWRHAVAARFCGLNIEDGNTQILDVDGAPADTVTRIRTDLPFRASRKNARSDSCPSLIPIAKLANELVTKQRNPRGLSAWSSDIFSIVASLVLYRRQIRAFRLCEVGEFMRTWGVCPWSEILTSGGRFPFGHCRISPGGFAPRLKRFDFRAVVLHGSVIAHTLRQRFQPFQRFHRFTDGGSFSTRLGGPTTPPQDFANQSSYFFGRMRASTPALGLPRLYRPAFL